LVLEYDAQGKLVGIDIDDARAKAEFHKLVVNKLPASAETIAGSQGIASDGQNRAPAPGHLDRLGT
jgi:hypothetical protein